MRLPETVGLVACILVVAGCTNPVADRVKRLEAENRLLTQFRKDVVEMDGLGTEGGLPKDSEEGCGRSEILILKTPAACSAERYAQGLLTRRNALKGTDIEEKEPMTDTEVAQWAMVGELNNRYRQLSTYGATRFKAIAMNIMSGDFREKTRPMKVLEYIRNYMYVSQKDFVDGLVKTAAGEKTALTVGKRMDEVGTSETEKKKGSDQAKKSDETRQQASAQGAKKWTYEQAMKEACEAGRQYREDVDLHGMRHSEAEYEAKAYSQHLADNSPAPRKALYDRIQKGLWMDSCQ